MVPIGTIILHLIFSRRGLSEWSLLTEGGVGGGATKRECVWGGGGGCEIVALQKVGAEKVLAML